MKMYRLMNEYSLFVLLWYKILFWSLHNQRQAKTMLTLAFTFLCNSNKNNNKYQLKRLEDFFCLIDMTDTSTCTWEITRVFTIIGRSLTSEKKIFQLNSNYLNEVIIGKIGIHTEKINMPNLTWGCLISLTSKNRV